MQVRPYVCRPFARISNNLVKFGSRNIYFIWLANNKKKTTYILVDKFSSKNLIDVIIV